MIIHKIIIIIILFLEGRLKSLTRRRGSVVTAIIRRSPSVI